MRSLLYLSREPLSPCDRAAVHEAVTRYAPGLTVSFASSPLEIPAGSVYEAVISPTIDWLPQALERIQDVPHLHFQSSGVEKLWEMDFDKERYILTKSSGIHAAAMSEYAIGTMLYFAKSFDKFVSQSRAREWRRYWLGGLQEKSLCILGLGSVGAELARRAKFLGMRVSGVSKTSKVIEGVDSTTSLETASNLVAGADYVVACLPLTTETRNLIDATFIRGMKKGAVLIDISRGGVVVSEAVCAAIDNRWLRGAALDVFPTEPLPKDSDLWNRPEVLLTPHVAGTTEDYVQGVIRVYAESIRAIRAGERPPTLVDPARGY